MSEMLERGLADIEADVRRTLETLHEPGNLIELRIFNGAKVGSNYHSDFDQLTKDVLRYEHEKHAHYQYYITLNELNPDIAARRNSIKWGREAKPTTADPGNYDRNNTALHRGFLQFIESNVDHDGVSIDLKVVNAARVVKLFGTVSRKGMNTGDRPHRRSRLIEIPKRQEILSIETLKGVIKIAGTDRGTLTKRDLSRLDVAAKLQEWGVVVRRVKEDTNGTRYILETCPFNSAHDRGEAWVYQFTDDGAINAKCHHDSCPKVRLKQQSSRVAAQIKKLHMLTN